MTGRDHAFGDTGNRCGIFRIGLHDGAEKLRCAVKIAICQKLLRVGQNGLDLSLGIARVRSGNLFDELLDLAFRNGTHEAIHGPAVGKGDDCRNGLDAELAGNGRMIVNVQLHELHTAIRLVDDLLKHRRQLFARAAPGRPEIHQNRLATGFFKNILGETGRRRVLDVAGGRTVKLAIVMRACGHLPAIGTAVRIIVAAHAGLP
ncbi:hypothetical protein D3C78_1253060 [compost metagenome]